MSYDLNPSGFNPWAAPPPLHGPIGPEYGPFSPLAAQAAQTSGSPGLFARFNSGWRKPTARALLPQAAIYGSDFLGDRIGGPLGEKVSTVGGGLGMGYMYGQLGGWGGKGLLKAAQAGVAGERGAALAATIAPKLAGKGGWIGTAAAGTLLALQLTGAGKKLPLIGGLFGGEEGGGGGGDELIEQWVNLGANPAEAQQASTIYQQLKDNDQDAVAEQFKQQVGQTLTSQLMYGTSDSAESRNYDRMQSSWIADKIMPIRDTAIANIEAARQSAMKSGMPEVANQYYAMSKNVANAYAEQAINSPINARLAKALDPENNQGTANNQLPSGLFEGLNANRALQNQAAALTGGG